MILLCHMKHVCVIKSPVGNLKIEEEDNQIVKVAFTKEDVTEIPDTLLKKCADELEEYFRGNRKEFDLSLLMKGTEFQVKVWHALEKIPYGETRSYQDIAQMIGKPKASRAVGMANHVNPIVILVPCHRVIGKNGKLTGYGGGLDKKKYLLELEGEHHGIFDIGEE